MNNLMHMEKNLLQTNQLTTGNNIRFCTWPTSSLANYSSTTSINPLNAFCYLRQIYKLNENQPLSLVELMNEKEEIVNRM